MRSILARLTPCVAICLLMTSCGAILEEAAEQALEQGGVEVELDDIEDGDFTVNIEGEDGEDLALDVDAGEGTVEFETEDGGGEFAINGGLAEGWPDEFPLPNDAVILTSLATEESEGSGYFATFTGPAESLDAYIEHFRGFDLPVVDENSLSVGAQHTIAWGTQEQPIGTVNLSTDGGELFGQLSMSISTE